MALTDLPPGAQHTVWSGTQRLLLCHTEDGVRAFHDACPHALQSLVGGHVEGSVITCPKHGARFDLRTGKPVNGVTKRMLRVFPVRLNAGRIQVDISYVSVTGF